MKWPRRLGRFAVVALLVVVLASTRYAMAARRSGVFVVDVTASDSAGRASASMAAREAAYRMAALHASDGSRGDDVPLKDCPHATDTGRAEAIGLSTRNASAVQRVRGKLTIAVPQKGVFENFVKFAIDIFETAMSNLEHPSEYELCAFDGSYDELVGNVNFGVFDAAVGDVTITEQRARIVDFTMPYAGSGVSLLVLANKDSKPAIQWIFLKPLTTELWLTTVGFFFFTGFVVWMIERPRNPVYQGSSLAQVSTALYFAFSTLTFSHGQIIRSPLSKIILVIWCFSVLVLVQSYTANLSSMLTAKKLRPQVTDLGQLVRNGDYIGYQKGAFVSSVLQKEGVRRDRLKPFNDQAEYAEALRNGSVSAIADEIPYLSYFLSDSHQQNKDFEMVGRLYKSPGFGFVFPRGSPLVHDLSIAILGLTAGNESLRIEHKWFGKATPSTADGSPIADSTALTLRSFSGLFVITGCVSTLMLFIRIGRSIYAKYSRVRGSGLQDAVQDGGSTRLGESRALQDGIGYGSVPDQSHLEVRSDHSMGARGSGRIVDNEETGQIQNGMQNGSEPAFSVQIEMCCTDRGEHR